MCACAVGSLSADFTCNWRFPFSVCMPDKIQILCSLSFSEVLIERLAVHANRVCVCVVVCVHFYSVCTN